MSDVMPKTNDELVAEARAKAAIRRRVRYLDASADALVAHWCALAKADVSASMSTDDIIRLAQGKAVTQRVNTIAKGLAAPSADAPSADDAPTAEHSA